MTFWAFFGSRIRCGTLVSFGAFLCLSVTACVPLAQYRLPVAEYRLLQEELAAGEAVPKKRRRMRPALVTCPATIADHGKLFTPQQRGCLPTSDFSKDRAANGEPKPWRYHLAVVEFDDQGEFWNRDQLDLDLQCLLYQLTGEKDVERNKICQKLVIPTAPDNLGIRPAIVMVYVHGWKHNASPRNEDRGGNLSSFHDVLARTASAETQRAKICQNSKENGRCEIARREVVGIYLGWRGKSFVGIPLLQEFTIFNRRQAAERVGRVAASHAIHRIGNWTKDFNENSLSVLVGHSLGAVILENILTRSLTAESDELQELLPADLAILINSANEAILAQQVVDTLGPPAPRAIDAWKQMEIPLIVSLASPGDKAVRYYFPLSQKFKTLFKHFRDPEQRFLYTHTPGFSKLPSLVSHKVTDHHEGPPFELPVWSTAPLPTVHLAKTACSPPTAADVESAATTSRKKLFTRHEKFYKDRLQSLEERVSDETTEDVPRCIEHINYTDQSGQNWIIERSKDTLNLSPYWVMTVDHKIVRKHTDIFNDEVVALIGTLINLKRLRVRIDDPTTVAQGLDP